MSDIIKFEAVCQELRDKYFLKQFKFKGRGKVRTISLKDEFAQVAFKYFVGTAHKSGKKNSYYAKHYPYEIVLDICETSGIDILNVIENRGRRL